MLRIATLGPEGSDSYQASLQYNKDAHIQLSNTIPEVIKSLTTGDVDLCVVPVYNTRDGEVKEYFRLINELEGQYWIDNVLLPIQLSLGVQSIDEYSKENVEKIIGRSTVFNQCEEYIAEFFPNATQISVNDIEKALLEFGSDCKSNCAVIESEQLLKRYGLSLTEREVVSHNRTRFAVLGKSLNKKTGYDATAIITRPLNDRVGMLVDILSEFTRRGINILDLRSENDVKTQKLQIYLELEGHYTDEQLETALENVERKVIQEKDCLKLLGSFPRLDMRIKQIESFGFIGSGKMSQWFAERLESEGYKTLVTGRSTKITPEEMIPQVNVVVICVPISVTSETVKKYSHLLNDGQALILLAGESENTLKTAIEHTSAGVEVMLVHNLWGPQAITMKDKNASIVRTTRSGTFCSEFEAFLYKHGAEIYHDSATKHDLLMGVGQKLPTLISVALAKTLSDHEIDCDDISSHSTLTSLYGILSMVRVHNQNPRTYAEIMSTSGEGRTIVRTFVNNISKLMAIAEEGEIENLCQIMEQSKSFMTESFLKENMQQAKTVDSVLGDSRKY